MVTTSIHQDHHQGEDGGFPRRKLYEYSKYTEYEDTDGEFLWHILLIMSSLNTKTDFDHDTFS